MLSLDEPNILWILILTFIFAFFLAFSIGANDVANSFATSIGSKVLTLRQACILATIFEISGSVLMGYKVSDTVRKGIIDTKFYDGREKLLLIGYLSSLIGSSVWMILATYYNLPISGTHSIIGAIVGFHIIVTGFSFVNYSQLLSIVLSWFISPLLSGLMSVVLFYLIHRFIIDTNNVVKRGLMSLPLFYGATVFINVFSIITNGPAQIGLGDFKWYNSILISFVISLIVAILVFIFVMPRQKKIIDEAIENAKKNNNNNESLLTINLKELEEGTTNKKKSAFNKIVPTRLKSQVTLNSNEVSFSDQVSIKDDKIEVACLFKYLQILTACFASFAHGGNDVSNAIGPLIGSLLLITDKKESPPLLMLYGGIGISLGLWCFGSRVIKTVGNNLTKIVPSTGFTIETGAASTVLLASKLGLPISTTHCKVGSVIMLGQYQGSRKSVNWSLLQTVVLAWIFTIPISAFLAGLSMFFLRYLE